jgi:hypothetical protein
MWWWAGTTVAWRCAPVDGGTWLAGWLAGIVPMLCTGNHVSTPLQAVVPVSNMPQPAHPRSHCWKATGGLSTLILVKKANMLDLLKVHVRLLHLMLLPAAIVMRRSTCTAAGTGTDTHRTLYAAGACMTRCSPPACHLP